MNTFINDVLNLYKTPEYQKLNAYYEQQTVYNMLAIAQSEDESLEVIYNSKAFQTAFRALYYNEAKNLLEEDFETADETTLVTDFWNSNENLFKVVLYNHCKNNPDKLKIISKVIKTNNRDNTRYLIGIGEDNWLNANGKPASKSEASYLIFKAYLMEYPATTLAELRKAFPCEELNAYYYDRYYNDLFYESNPDNVDETGYEILTYTAGKHKGEEAMAKRSFYLDEEKLLPIENGQKNAMCVKMWRKGDFDKLVEFVEENYKFIVIEEC